MLLLFSSCFINWVTKTMEMVMEKIVGIFIWLISLFIIVNFAIQGRKLSELINNQVKKNDARVEKRLDQFRKKCNNRD